MKFGNRANLLPLRLLGLLATTLALAAMFVPSVALASAATPGRALTLPFPRVSHFWPREPLSPQAVAEAARYDYLVLQNPEKNAALRALNPDIILLRGAKLNGCELGIDPNKLPSEDPNTMLSLASPRWILTQVGTTLSAAIGTTATVVPIRAATVGSPAVQLFKVGEILVIEDELCRIETVGTNTLTVKRGVVFPAAAHDAGTRAASAVTFWPGTVVMDLTANCPAVTVDPAVGPETWGDWNARKSADLVSDPTWDGIYVDRADGNESWLVNAGYTRSIDPDRLNTLPTSYAAFDAAWNAGQRARTQKLRALVGDDRLIYTNGSVTSPGVLNGTTFEQFPDVNKSQELWHQTVFGPQSSTNGSYFGWLGDPRQPNLTTVMTYQYDTANGPSVAPAGWLSDPQTYRRMRFGLATALLGDGFFADRPGTQQLLWLDEYDNAGAGKGYLGQPLGAAYGLSAQKPDLLLGDGDLDTAAEYSAWKLAALSPVVASKASDSGTCRVQVTTAGADWKLNLTHPLSFVAGRAYRVSFSAKASAGRVLKVLIGDATNGGAYYSDLAPVATTWTSCSVVVRPTKTGDGTVNIYFGDLAGTVWFDDVTVSEVVPEVWRRDFAGGTSLVNASESTITVSLGGAYRKIKGTQAPTVNDGSLVTAVTLPPKDGLVLVRTAQTAPVLDTTPPATAISALPAGWARNDVTFSLTASDTGSPFGISTRYGLNTLPLSLYSAPITISTQGTTTISYSSLDASANAEPVKTATVRIDKTAPALSGARTGAPNAAGWHRTPVTVRFSASDAMSGVAAVSSDVVLSSNGAAQAASGSATDIAGNAASTTLSGINIDQAAPATTDDHVATYQTSAAIRLAPADALSGVAATTWTLDGTLGSGTTVSTSVGGAHTLSYRSTDVAGNAETTHNVSFTVVPPVVVPSDTTAPVTTISGVTSGWSTSDVVFSLTASDAGTPAGISSFYGLDVAAASTYTGPVTVNAQGTTTVSYRSTDAPGNAETAKTATVRIDRTLPALTLDAAATYTGSATVHALASDALSGLDRVELKLDAGAWTTATQISTSVLGAHTIYARAFDVAGNERDLSATFSVSGSPNPDPDPDPVPDTTAPVTTISDLPAGWVNRDVTFSLTASDAGTPAGISSFYGLDVAAASAYTGPVTVNAQGTTTVSYRSTDAPGNAETAKTATVRIDRTLPTLTLDAAATYTGSATVHALASDALSGLDRVELKLDAGAWTTATQLSTSVLGAHTIYARTFDVAGNERDVSAAFSVSGSPDPDTIPTVTPAPAATATLRASTTTLTYGQATTLRITVTPAYATSTHLERRIANSPQWEQVATLTTDASGAAQLVVSPLVTTEYRTVLVDDDIVSSVVRVGVKARATFGSSKTTIRRKRLVTMSGTVTTGAGSLTSAADVGAAPIVSGEIVRAVLQRKVGHRWINVKRVSTRSTGRYRVHVRPRVRGSFSYRIRVAGSETNAVGVSRTIRIRVR